MLWGVRRLFWGEGVGRDGRGDLQHDGLDDAEDDDGNGGECEAAHFGCGELFGFGVWVEAEFWRC